MFSNYRMALVEFHNNFTEGKDIDLESRSYLLENALKINLDSIIHIRKNHPMWGLSTGIMDEINDIVTFKCYDFTRTCQDFDNMLVQNIGAFKDIYQETRSQIINPISLVKNGISLIFDIIPILNLIPTNLKKLLINIFLLISAVETLLSLFSQKLLIEQIIEWISELPFF